MKKILAIFIIYTLSANLTYAADVPSCPAGQYYIATSGCTDCPTGQWSAGGNVTSCSNCNKPAGATFTSHGTNANGCSWKIECSAGNGWSGTACIRCTGNRYSTTPMQITGTGSSSSEKLCPETCPAHSSTTSNGQDCSCDTHFTENSAGECEGDVYKIELKKNCTFCTVKENPIYEKYSSGFAYNTNNPASWTPAASFKVPLDSKNQDTSRWWGIKFSGYFTKQSGGNKIINADGTLVQKSNTQFTEPITLHAQYDSAGDPITIIYKETGQTDKKEICNPDGECTIAYPQTPCIAGKKFDGWSCTSGCNASNIFFKAADTFNDIKDYMPLQANPITIVLTAQTSPCQKGKYCTCESNESKDHNCPMGSTSDSGADSIKKCYITTSTRFCDRDGSEAHCFTLPGTAGSKIFSN